MNNSHILQSIKFLIGAVTVSAISFPITAFAAPLGAIDPPPPTPTEVPEPFTVIGTLVGGTAALRMRNKLKANAS